MLVAERVIAFEYSGVAVAGLCRAGDQGCLATGQIASLLRLSDGKFELAGMVEWAADSPVE